MEGIRLIWRGYWYGWNRTMLMLTAGVLWFGIFSDILGVHYMPMSSFLVWMLKNITIWHSLTHFCVLKLHGAKKEREGLFFAGCNHGVEIYCVVECSCPSHRPDNRRSIFHAWLDFYLILIVYYLSLWPHSDFIYVENGNDSKILVWPMLELCIISNHDNWLTLIYFSSLMI